MATMNILVTVSRKSSYDVYGTARVVVVGTDRCAIVKLRHKVEHTTVRADSGATRGHADEYTTDNLLLMPANTKVLLDDIIEVIGIKMQVKMKQPRYRTNGQIDHYEVSGELWA